MPAGDRSGPDGAGPMTGRGMGYCAGFDAPGYVRPGGGYARGGGYAGRGGGYGAGRGAGRGRNAWGWLGGGLRHRRGAGYGPWGPGWSAYGEVPAGAPVRANPAAPANEAEALKAQAEYLADALADVQRRLTDLEKEE